MNLSGFLDDFGAPRVTAAATQPQISDEDLESQRLESFENGYRAGWDDAIKAQSDDRTRISSAFGQHLQDLSFTYHEAYAQVMNAMSPLLEDMVRILLPELARQTLGVHIVERIEAEARALGALKVIVAVSPDNMEAVGPLLEGEFNFPVELVADDTLTTEQADLRFGETEKQIDLTSLLASAREAVEAFAHDNRRTVAHG